MAAWPVITEQLKNGCSLFTAYIELNTPVIKTNYW